MANTTVPQANQIRKSDSYIDTRVPSEANYQTNATDLQYDMNSIRSALNNFLKRDGASFPAADGWWTDLVVPAVFTDDPTHATTIRGINKSSSDLYGIQRQRILKRGSVIGADLTGVLNATFLVITTGGGVIGTTAALDGGVSLGTVVASAGVTFGQNDLTLVGGANALQPKNLVILTDEATGEVVLGVISGQQVYGLIQGDATLADGGIISATTAPGGVPLGGQVQFSFVIRGGAGNDELVEATAGDMNGITFNYGYVRRDAFEDCPEEAWLGEGFVDSGVANATRQAVYNNGSDLTTTANAILTLGTGFNWNILDVGSDVMASFVDANATTGSTITLGQSGTANGQTFTVNPEVVSFTHGATFDDATADIRVGVVANTIAFETAGIVRSDSGQSLSITTTSGAIDITAVTGGAIDIQAVGNATMDSSAGSINIAGDADTGAVNIGASASARAVTVGNVTAGTTLLLNSGSAGVDLSAPSNLGELVTLTNTDGTNGWAVEMFVNDVITDPDTVGVAAPVGSVMWKDVSGAGTAGEAWLKVAVADIGWEKFQTGADANTLDEVVQNQAGLAFLSGAFTTAWGIADTRAVNFTDDGGTVLLGISSAPDGIVSTVATFDVNASGLISMDSTAGAITLDAATAIGISSGTGDIANSTATSAVAATGDFTILTGAVTAGAFNAGDMNVVLGAAVSGAGGGYGFLAGAATVGTGGSFSVVGGDVTTGTGGSIEMATGAASDAAGFAGDYSIATGTGAGRNGSYDATFASYLVDVANDDANTGTVLLDSTKLLFGHGDGSTPLEEGDAHVILNPQWTADAETTGGLISVRSRGASTATTSIAAGGAESSVTNSGLNPLVYITEGDGAFFSVGEFVLLAGMNLETNNGLYEIAAIANPGGAPDEITLRGVGSGTDTVREWDARQLVTDTTVAGSMTNVNICVFRCSNGTWFVADDENADDMTFFGVNSGGVNLDGAYIGGNTATVTDADGSFTLSNTTTTITSTDMFTVTNSPSVATTGNAATIAHVPGASSSGDTVNILTGANVTGTSFFLDNLGTGSAFTVQDGSTDVVDVSAAGLVKFTPTSGQDFLVDTLGAGSVSLDAASSSNFTVDGSTAGTLTNSFLATNSDGTAASAAQLNLVANQNSAAATAVVSTVNLQATNDGTAAAASSTVNIKADVTGAGANATTADINIRSTGVSSGVVNTVNVQDTATGSVNVATGAFANDVTLGDTTGTSSFAFNAGSGNITGVASSAVVGSVATSITTTNTDNTAASSADVVLQADASGASAAVVSNITVDAVVGNATGTATGNFMNDGTNAGITVANIASGNSAASNTVNIASPSTGGTSTVNIASTGTGPADVNIGNTGSTATINHTSGTNTMDFTSTGMAASSDWVLTFPTKNVYGTPNLDADGATNAGVIVNEATYTSFENGSLNGSLVIGRNTGYTAAVGVDTYEVTVVLCNATTDTITAFTNNGAAADPTATLTTGGTQAAGNFVLVTGSISRENDGIYQVVSDAGNVLTLEATPGADAGFVKQQVSTTVGDSATVCNVTLSVMRVSAAGEWQIFENANTVASIVYQDFGSTATTLAGSVANVGASPATMSADFDWRISDNQSLSFSTAAASNENLLSLAPADGADQIVIGNTVAGTDVDVNAGGEITLDATGDILIGTAVSGDILIGIASGGSRIADTLSMGSLAGISAIADTTITLSTSTSTIASGGDITATAGASTFVGGNGGGFNLTTGAASAATGGGLGGDVTITIGEGAQGTAGVGPIAAGAGGTVTATLGAGGAGTGAGTIAQGSAAGPGGGWNVTGGVGGQADAGIGTAPGGGGGQLTFIGGIGGNGTGTAVASEVAGDAGDGAKVSLIGGKGGDGQAGAIDAANAGNAGAIGLTAGVAGIGAGAGDNASGGNIELVPSLAGVGGGGTAGVDGFVNINSASPATGTVLRLDTGGTNGAVADLFVGGSVAAPTTGDTAKAGSLFLYNDGATADTGGRLYLQVDADGASDDGDNWREVQTIPAVGARQFAQVVVNATITGSGSETSGSNLEQGDLLSGTMPTRAAGHDFDTQSEIYFNGVLMMNGTGNDVKVATIGVTDVDLYLLAGTALIANDIVTITYYNI